MICPSCEHVVYNGAEQCPHCGYTHAQLKQQAGGQIVRLPFLQDKAHILSESSYDHLNTLIHKLHHDLLGVAIFVIIDDTQTDATGLHTTFYLNEAECLNESQLPAFETERFLLYINTSRMEARIALSHGLEQLTTQTDWHALIIKNHALFFQGLYAEGISAILKSFVQIIHTLPKPPKK